MSQTLRIKVNGKIVDFTFYTFCKYVLNYSKLNEVHKKWCEEIDSTDKRKMFLKPRGTYKSTIFTVCYPIWKLLHNPNERILIVNATSDNAEAFLREITTQYLRNDRFKDLFGEKIDPRASKVASITVLDKKSYHKEPSIATIGVLGTLVSAHYSTIICDDLCNQQDRESDSVREKKKRWFQDLLSILDPDGELIVIGTKWHYQDLYAYIQNDLNPKLPPEDQYKISIESCYKEDGVTPAFPTILSAETLEKLKAEKGPLEFSSQYQNIALPQESQIFFEEDFKTFTYLGGHRVLVDGKEESLTFVGYCDLSMGRSKSSDFTAVVTLGKDKAGNIYLVDIFLQRVPPDKTIKVILEKQKHFDYKHFGVESNVFQSLFADNLKKKSVEEEAYLPVNEVRNSTNKALRIQSLQPIIKQGLLKIRSDWKQDKEYKELINQFVYFPMYGHDDGPDAVEGAFSLLKKKGYAGKPFGAGTGATVNVSGYSDLDMSKFTIEETTNFSKEGYKGIGIPETYTGGQSGFM